MLDFLTETKNLDPNSKLVDMDGEGFYFVIYYKFLKAVGWEKSFKMPQTSFAVYYGFDKGEVKVIGIKAGDK